MGRRLNAGARAGLRCLPTRGPATHIPWLLPWPWQVMVDLPGPFSCADFRRYPPARLSAIRLARLELPAGPDRHRPELPPPAAWLAPPFRLAGRLASFRRPPGFRLAEGRR